MDSEIVVASKTEEINAVLAMILRDGIYMKDGVVYNCLVGDLSAFRAAYLPEIGWSVIHATWYGSKLATLSTYVVPGERRNGYGRMLVDAVMGDSGWNLGRGTAEDREFRCGYWPKTSQPFYTAYFDGKD